jgi:tetratricopeptide (TPR) repeat protein
MADNTTGAQHLYGEGNTAQEIERASRLIKDGEFSSAAILLRAILSREPENETAWRLLGGAMASQGDTNAAIEAFRRATLLDPYEAKNHYNLGVALQTAGRLLEASESLERALRLDPDHIQAQQRVEVIRKELAATPPPSPPVPPPPIPPTAPPRTPYVPYTPPRQSPYGPPEGSVQQPVLHSVPSQTPPVYGNRYSAPPPVLGMGHQQQGHHQNTSGMMMAAPPGANFWNWGAFGFSFFGLGFLWSYNMRLHLIGTIQLVLFLLGWMFPLSGLLSLGLSIYLGSQGSDQAWQNRRFNSLRDFQRCQTAWGWWALGLALVVPVTAFIIIMMALGSGL